MEYFVKLRKFLDRKCLELELLRKELNAENYVKSVQAKLSSTVLLNKRQVGKVACMPPSSFIDGRSWPEKDIEATLSPNEQELCKKHLSLCLRLQCIALSGHTIDIINSHKMSPRGCGPIVQALEEID